MIVLVDLVQANRKSLMSEKAPGLSSGLRRISPIHLNPTGT